MFSTTWSSCRISPKVVLVALPSLYTASLSVGGHTQKQFIIRLIRIGICARFWQVIIQVTELWEQVTSNRKKRQWLNKHVSDLKNTSVNILDPRSIRRYIYSIYTIYTVYTIHCIVSPPPPHCMCKPHKTVIFPIMLTFTDPITKMELAHTLGLRVWELETSTSFFYLSLHFQWERIPFSIQKYVVCTSQDITWI